MNLNRDQARDIFAKSGLLYADITRENLQWLRNAVNDEMKASGLFKDSYRCKQRPFMQHRENGNLCARVECKAYYFENREAVSFNPDGFIGFAGWSSDTNVQPVLRGFISWVKEISVKDTLSNKLKLEVE